MTLPLTRLVPWTAVAFAGLAFGLGPSSEAKGPSPARELTFFVASDTHFGVPGIEEGNRRLIEELNRLPGREYPPAVGGRVGTPRGVLILGDLTDYSTEEQWRQFEAFYGLTGKEGLLRFPVFEALGNHDFMGDTPVVGHITRRHGGLAYSFDWDDLHVVCLGMHPNAARLKWLERDLAGVRRGRPLVLFFHYAIEGPWRGSWESDDEREELARILAGHRVAAIFHGHAHHSGHYRWRDYDVFRPGSPKHSSHVVLAVRLRGDELAVAYRDFNESAWEQALVRTIRPPAGRARTRGPGLGSAPALTWDVRRGRSKRERTST